MGRGSRCPVSLTSIYGAPLSCKNGTANRKIFHNETRRDSLSRRYTRAPGFLCSQQRSQTARKTIGWHDFSCLSHFYATWWLYRLAAKITRMVWLRWKLRTNDSLRCFRRAIFLKKDAKGFFSIDVYPILCGDATREISRQILKRALVIRSSITSYSRNNGLAGVSIAFWIDTFSIAESKLGNDPSPNLITSFVAITCRFNRSFARSLDILAPTTCTRQQVALDNDTRPANAFSSAFIYFDSYFFHIDIELACASKDSLDGASSCQNFRISYLYDVRTMVRLPTLTREFPSVCRR